MSEAIGFFITYEVITPESAEYGDAEDRGWIDGGFMVEDKPDNPPLEFDPEFDYDPDLHDSMDDAILEWARDELRGTECVGGWWVETDPFIDYETGEETTRSYHPHNIPEYVLRNL